MEKRYPIPPFTAETARQKVQAAEDAWNTRNPELVSKAYTIDTNWSNRSEFITGREQVVDFLERKWKNEIDYKLKKQLWTYTDNKIAVTFQYEWRDTNGNWFRSYGNEMWEFDTDGYMVNRQASINDLPIAPEERILL